MTEWNKQAEDMIKTWTGAQQKMWESWLTAMQGMSSGPNFNTGWEQSIEVWRDSVQRALEAQVAWTQFWANSVASSTNAPKEMVDWSDQVMDMMKRWTETQMQLSETWFETMKKSDPVAVAQGWNSEEAHRVVHSWQEAAQKMLEAQMGWLRLWSVAQTQQK